MDMDEDDFVFYGTPIEREEEITSRKKKAVAEASGQLRSLPSWKQEVRDEEGRRRFHGAFTGGFSAGYYNTAGSKEGWTPQSFTSSRKNRAEAKQQSIFNFLDDDEKAEIEGRSLGTSLQFDTFGFTAAEVARKQAEKEHLQRPSAIPGPVPDEIVVPATESVGVKLLLKMGWRHGHSIQDSRSNSLYDARREARKAFLALSSDDSKAQLDGPEPVESNIDNINEQTGDGDIHFSQSTPVYVLHPKQDLHGLGYDPFKHAPEFREKKRSRLSGNRELGHRKAFSIKDNLFSSKSGKVAPGFGIGALEELDDEDEDVYASAIEFEDTYDVQEVEEPSGSSMGNKLLLSGKEKGVLPGFKVASNSEMQLERFNPPVIPKGFVPHHKFPGPLVVENRPSEPPPPEVSPPEDNNLKVLIEGVATLVARCGKLFEDISKEKHQSNPLFSFLGGGKGHDYYARKLWEEQCKRNDQTKLQLAGKSSSSVQKMTAENRGRILGERPLERSSNDSSLPNTSADVQLQVNLADTFTRPSSYIGLPEIAKPFKDNPEKQERFEQFLKQKYQGGLRSTDSGGASSMSEAARARERLDFEAAAEAMEKAKWGKEMQPSAENFMDMLAVGGMQFTSGGLEQAKVSQAVDPKLKKMYPKREEFQWRPSPILCKRFDLIDPYMGKPPPAPRMRSKMDSLIFTTDSTKATKSEETVAANREAFVSRSDTLGTSKEVIEEETEVEVEVENVERPVDLYKAIFSDDSDSEGQETILNQVEEDPQKKMEAASKTLNRLIADDFLESLGKELGLEVPPDMPYSNNKARDNVSLKEYANSGKENNNYLAVESGSFSIPGTISGTSKSQESPHNKPYKAQESGLLENDLVPDNLPRHRQARSGSSSSDDGRSRHSRRHKNSSSDSETVSSGDHHNRRSKGKKRGSSREKSSSSRKRSKHHKHRSRGSSSKSHHSSDKDRAAGKRDKRKRRD